MSFLFRRAEKTDSSDKLFEDLIAGLDHVQLSKSVTTGKLRGSGGFADVHEGLLKVKGRKGKMKVAVKKFRVVLNKEEQVVKMFTRELLIWGQLKNDNILPLLGVMSMDGLPCMVSEWMDNGTMNAYLKSHSDANVLELVEGIASGLAYLHDREVVHGDLKGDNVLISQDGRALLCDFGIARLLSNGITIAGTTNFKGSTRWMAPELLTSAGTPREHQLHTNETDVWAFGMTIYEAISREIPFSNHRVEASVIMSILNGELPAQPQHSDDIRWNLAILWPYCLECWRHNPSDRPTMTEVTERLQGCGFIVRTKNKLRCADLYGKTEQASDPGEASSTYLAVHFKVGDGEGQSVVARKVLCKRRREKHFAEVLAEFVNSWQSLEHENVVRLLGITILGGVLCTVEKWTENGSMSMYLKDFPDANTLGLVQGIGCGLAHLHIRGIIHGNLKGGNVLISSDGQAVLTEFGTTQLLIDAGAVVGPQSLNGSARWMAPELFALTDEARVHEFYSKASDVWAFGMVVYEALFREVPFNVCHSDEEVMTSIRNGELPLNPNGTSAGVNDFELLWECCQRCWSYKPADRPSMHALIAQLKCKGVFVKDMRAVRASRSWISPTGRLLAIIENDEKSISFLETRTMSKRRHGLKAEFKVQTVAWSNTEEHIVTRSDGEILQKWDNIFKSPVVVARSTRRCEGTVLEFSPDDRFIASFHWTTKLWDSSNLSLIWEHPGGWYSVAFHPLGSKLVFYDLDDVLDVNIEDLEKITATQYRVDFFVYRLVFGPSGDMCVANTRGVKIFSGDLFKEKNSLPYYHCKAMEFTPDGKRILFVLVSRAMVLWDIATGEAVERVTLPVDLKLVRYWSAKITKNCRVVRLLTYTGDTWTTYVLHLTSSYY